MRINKSKFFLEKFLKKNQKKKTIPKEKTNRFLSLKELSS
ncbi:hypothetical protein LEP1GSC125_3172 [Leptospira mayottensis 200901122]|uniref:Uncharacterized protein n=1 Tax=Leptospira mayottensis 200901122 TaxID=1193010 RepID=A0AA87SW46_9LEPT|nr:hypothetical protein LEP1GSC125_3172 [Leptospira mayottensis 200901122]